MKLLKFANFRGLTMRKLLYIVCVLVLLGITGCSKSAEQAKANATMPAPKDAVAILNEQYKLKHLVDDEKAPKVYFTKNITPEGLLAVYEAVGQKLDGRVGIKLSFEIPNGPYIKPALLKPLRDKVNGVFMDSNGFAAPRNTTAGHLQIARQHGFMDVGPVDILDADGDLDIPVNGKYLKFHRVGSHFKDYDTLISIINFKPHYLPVYGGTTKNLTICLGSISGKANIHSAGKNLQSYSPAPKNQQLEALAEATEAVVNFKKDRWVYINVLAGMNYKDSCKNIHDLKDVGILASSDPIAVDQAAIDFTYGQATSEKLRGEWEDNHWTSILEIAEKRGVGKRNYRLLVVDK